MGGGRMEKLKKQQAKGKKRLRLIGNVPVPKEAFIAAFKADSMDN